MLSTGAQKCSGKCFIGTSCDRLLRKDTRSWENIYFRKGFMCFLRNQIAFAVGSAASGARETLDAMLLFLWQAHVCKSRKIQVSDIPTTLQNYFTIYQIIWFTNKEEMSSNPKTNLKTERILSLSG